MDIIPIILNIVILGVISLSIVLFLSKIFPRAGSRKKVSSEKTIDIKSYLDAIRRQAKTLHDYDYQDSPSLHEEFYDPIRMDTEQKDDSQDRFTVIRSLTNTR